MRRHYLPLLLIAMLIPPVTAAADDDDVVIIVNNANTQDLTLADIKGIYTDKIVTWQDDQRISIYNLPVSSPVREVFSRRVLGMSAMEAAAVVSNRNITNTLRNFQRTTNEELLVTIISKKHTAIGYCSRGAIKGRLGIRVIATLD